MINFAQLDLVHLSANVATVLFMVFIGAQLLAAAGVLPVSMFWGGRKTELTPSLRLMGVVAAVLLSAFIYVIRYRAGLVGSMPLPTAVRVGAWLVTGYMALNVLGNFASKSPVEKFLFGPLTILLTVSCLIVVASSNS